MALISLREYGKIHVGEEYDPLAPALSFIQGDVLANLKPTHGIDVFKYVNRSTLSAQQYVGVYQLGTHTVEVLPKIDGDDKSVRRNLVGMLAVARDLAISEGDIAKVANQSHGILEILIRLFCDKLFAQVHRGLVRRYEGREENLNVLRGRLGIAEQVRLNAANPERLFCRFEEFQQDNPLNQVLRAAIRLLLGVARTLQNQRQLTELLLVFEGVSDCPRTALPWHRVVFDRLSDRYQACYKLADLFLRNSPPDVSGGRAQGFSLFFDMNVLFEEYIGRVAQRMFGPLGYQVQLQGPSKHLVFDMDQSQPAFAMKPDVVGLRQGIVEWIIDTKWKQLSLTEAKSGVAQSDLYQMHGYANTYKCPEVMLLYPHHQGLGEMFGIRNRYMLHPWLDGSGTAFAERRICIATIDLSNLKTVGTQLASIIALGRYANSELTRMRNDIKDVLLDEEPLWEGLQQKEAGDGTRV